MAISAKVAQEIQKDIKRRAENDIANIHKDHKIPLRCINKMVVRKLSNNVLLECLKFSHPQPAE